MKFGIAILFVFASLTAQAAVELQRPVDPFESLPKEEKLTFMERERSLRFLNLVAGYDVSKKMPSSYSVAHLLDVARTFEPRFGAGVDSTPLALLNGSLFLLHIQYRNHTPVEYNGKLVDSESQAELREFIKQTARVLISAIGTLPDRLQPIELEFKRQSSLSNPLKVLRSYLNPGPNAEGFTPEPLFGGELQSDFEKQIEVVENRAKISTRVFEKVRSVFGTKSCRDAFL